MTYFSLIKYIGRDIYNIGDNLTEAQVRMVLLRADDESYFQVREWNDDFLDPDDTPKLIDYRNGEEWLNNHLFKNRGGR